MSVPRLAQRNVCIADTEQSDWYYQAHPLQKQAIIPQLCSQVAFTLLTSPRMLCPPVKLLLDDGSKWFPSMSLTWEDSYPPPAFSTGVGKHCLENLWNSHGAG